VNHPEHHPMHQPDGEPQPLPVIVFLSGSRRGTTLRLGGERACIGTDPSCEVRVPMDTEPLPLPHHATLTRRGGSYEVTTSSGAEVWVNGERVEHLVLASGDVMEIGRDGAVLRFRIYEPGSAAYKSLREVFSDCYECARAENTVARKAATLMRAVPRELATNTSGRFRILMVLALLSLATATGVLARRSMQLEEQLVGEIERVSGLSDLVARADDQSLGQAELEDLVAQLGSTRARVDSLEALSTANTRVVAGAASATLFIQGSYRFVQPVSGQPLRMVIGPDGRPVTNALGHPALTLEGDGPPLEVFLTGTGFVASPDGLVLTNRHVAVPWEFDEASKGMIESGFVAEWTRLVGYLPGIDGPLEIEVVAASDDADLAVVRSRGMSGRVPWVELGTDEPAQGDAVIVMGYPLGLRALMARSDEAFIRELQADHVGGFFEQAERLAAAGFMHPLATRGIVGQVTRSSVVYDAETTSGGSGGPVVTLSGGKVVAINMAILPEFGGSNLGVPAARARALLEQAEGR
jgi:serine protease Do